MSPIIAEAAPQGKVSLTQEAVSPQLSWRVWAFVSVMALECATLTAMPHSFWIPSRTVLTVGIVFAVALLFFGRRKLAEGGLQSSGPAVPASGLGHISAPFLVLHVAALTVAIALTLVLMRAYLAGAANDPVRLSVWCTAIALLPVSLAGALTSARRILVLAKRLGSAWALAAFCGLLLGLLRNLLVSAWDARNAQLEHWLQVQTTRVVFAILRLFFSDVTVDPATSLITTDHFQVIIGGICSGIEGLALVLVLTISWLVYARRELRFDRAWLLVPVSLVLIWTLNIVRLVALVAIGDAGHPEIAMGGFHSEGGWIMFNVVALGFLLTVERVRWFRKAAVGVAAAPGMKTPELAGDVATDDRNVAAIYLLPFLVMLACSLLSRAASDGGAFDALYPVRLLAVAVVMLTFRKEYRKIDWHFGWLGVVAGLAVFVFWLGFQQWTDRAAGVVNSGAGLAAGLAQLATWKRIGWQLARTISATITVPFAEELAFRGFLARRIMSADVERVSLRRLSPLAIVVSSVLFGLMHGKMWIAGALAGLVFALVAKWRGRLGEAFAAHATANLAIAVWVLTRGDYSLW